MIPGLFFFELVCQLECSVSIKAANLVIYLAIQKLCLFVKGGAKMHMLVERACNVYIRMYILE